MDRARVRQRPRGEHRNPLPMDEARTGLASVELELDAQDVVFVKSVLEASDGLASMFATRERLEARAIEGSPSAKRTRIVLGTSPERLTELEKLVFDLSTECALTARWLGTAS